MNKITETIELDPRKLDLERLPIERCVFANKSIDELKDQRFNKLAGIRFFPDVGLVFVTDNGLTRQRCAEAIERYPRDVPEGVTPLPDDKPFLFYIGLCKPELKSKVEAGEYYTLREGIRWTKGYEPKKGEPIAFDVSARRAVEHYPEFVEAMGYEPIYDPDGLLKGHKIDGRSYDLEWDLVEQKAETSDVQSSVEPVDVKDYLKLGTDYYGAVKVAVELAFNAGKERGKWEATNWKHETAREAYENNKFYGMSFAIFEYIFLRSRETKGSE